MNALVDYIRTKNAQWKANLLKQYIHRGEKIMDFGCGDLFFAKELQSLIPSLSITGIDVVDIPDRDRSIQFVRYDGKRLPFKNNSFDTVISFYVFHHCEDIEISIRECKRVARKRIVMIEAIGTNSLEMFIMRCLDWLYNVWKPSPIPLTFQFRTIDQWSKIIRRQRLRICSIKALSPFPFSLFPVGKAYLFEMVKTS